MRLDQRRIEGPVEMEARLREVLGEKRRQREAERVVEHHEPRQAVVRMARHAPHEVGRRRWWMPLDDPGRARTARQEPHALLAQQIGEPERVREIAAVARDARHGEVVERPGREPGKAPAEPRRHGVVRRPRPEGVPVRVGARIDRVPRLRGQERRPHVDDLDRRVRRQVRQKLVQMRDGAQRPDRRRHVLRIDVVLVRRDDQQVGDATRGEPGAARLEDGRPGGQLGVGEGPRPAVALERPAAGDEEPAAPAEQHARRPRARRDRLQPRLGEARAVVRRGAQEAQ